MKLAQDRFVAVFLSAIAVLTPAAYVGCYCWLGQTTAAYKFQDTWIRRSFPNKGLAIAFQPLAKAESWITGWDVQAVESNPNEE